MLKKGDKIICVEPSRFLTMGKEYLVEHDQDDIEWLYVRDDFGMFQEFFAYRFIPAGNEPEPVEAWWDKPIGAPKEDNYV